jgi:hypothetical protein
MPDVLSARFYPGDGIRLKIADEDGIGRRNPPQLHPTSEKKAKISVFSIN